MEEVGGTEILPVSYWNSEHCTVTLSPWVEEVLAVWNMFVNGLLLGVKCSFFPTYLYTRISSTGSLRLCDAFRILICEDLSLYG